MLQKMPTSERPFLILLFIQPNICQKVTKDKNYSITEKESNPTKLAEIKRNSLKISERTQKCLGGTQFMTLLFRHEVSVENEHGKEVYRFEVVEPT